MGTSLTGLTPSTTYDALIKVGDNAPLDGTLKTISDGLGNDSALALSTGAATITGTLGVSNRLSLTGVGTSELYTTDGSGMYLTANTAAGMYLATEGAFIFRKSTAPFTEYTRITSTGNVGIGTSSPDGKLDVASAGNLVSTGVFTNPHLALTATTVVDTDSFVGITYATSDAANYGWSLGAKRETGGNGFLEIRQHFNSATGTQIARFTANGLCFGSDTAAANALDDYEEGTWTPTLGGTWSTNPTSLAGLYTKIGNMVYIRLDFTGGVKASNTAGWFDGLPFSGAVGGGGTVSNVSVEDKGIVLLDNSTRVWTTNNDFGGLGTKVMASYRV